MPYKVAKSSSCPKSKPWACMKKSDGTVMGCHASRNDAMAQMKALYANEGKKNMIDDVVMLRAFEESELKKGPVYVDFADKIDLTAVAKAAKDSGSEYIVIEGMASTAQLNSHGFMIPASAWKREEALRRYEANSIVLFNHNGNMPVGQAIFTDIEARDTGLFVRLRIRYNAVLPTGEKIGDVIADGTLKALSCGIQITEIEIADGPEDGDFIIIAAGVELTEISVVSVPSDPGACTSVKETLSHIVQLSAIEVASNENEGGNTMLKLLAAKLGLDPEKATEAEIMAAWEKSQNLSMSAITALGLDPKTATTEAINAELARRDPAKAAKLQAELSVERAIRDGKIAPKDEATRTWALSYAEKDPDGFTQWVKLAAAITPNTQTIVPVAGAAAAAAQGGGAPAQGSTTLTKEDRDICTLFGYFDTPEKMEAMAETTPNVALGWVFGRPGFGLTNADRETLAKRRAMDEVCGIQIRQ